MRGREGGRRDEHPKEKAMRSIFGELDSSRLHLFNMTVCPRLLNCVSLQLLI